jgi:alkylation response protein AidB-like acyl-CoA dehydrogenase
VRHRTTMSTETASSVTEASLRNRVREALERFDPDDRSSAEAMGALYDAGLAWVWFPSGLGGLDIEPRWQAIVNDEVKELGGSLRRPRFNPVGTGMAAPILVAEARVDQAQNWLRPMFTGEEIWAQLFSEPTAGSDIAALATRAVRDGQGWRVTGQKVWSTRAHDAKWAVLVARTDASAPKHKGLTYFVIDMDQPGVVVRPLRQMTGDAEFNEVFLDDAWVPDDQRMGEVDQGWGIVLATLMNERQSITNVSSTPPQTMQRAIGLYQDRRDELGPVALDGLVHLWIQDRVIRLTTTRAADMRKSGSPGAEGSIGKLARTIVNQRLLEFCVDLMGPDGMLYPTEGFDLTKREASKEVLTDVRFQFLRGRAGTIEGGTSEIQRNIIGARVLGLPPEPKVERSLAGSNVEH